MSVSSSGLLSRISFDLKKIGKIIGAGENTVVISIENSEWKFSKLDNAVLIISCEPQKREILNAIFKGSTAQTEKIKKAPDSIQDYVYELEESGFDLFFASKLEQVEDSYFNKETISFMHIFSKDNWSNPTTNIGYILDNFNSMIQVFDDLNQEVVNAIKVSLNNIKHVVKNPVVADLHTDQFCRDNSGKLICIDPVYFDVKSMGWL